MKMIPSSTPKLLAEIAEQKLVACGLDPSKEICLLGIRGYYLDTMGDAGKNDRGIYDDAMFIVGPEIFVSFNANLDPSAFRKHIASLKAGTWTYKLGIHGLSKAKAKQYEALVQGAKVTVARDGEADQTGLFGINIHRGGYNTTSSLGCQTIYPAQWDSFIATVKAQLKKAGQKTIKYCLLEESRPVQSPAA